MLLNGRMSDRSFTQWQRVPGFARHVVGSFDHIRARSDLDAERLKALGGVRVESPGDLKFAASPLSVDQVELERLKGLLRDRPAWLAASTHPGEEALIADAHRIIALAHPHLLTIIAPRHPERGPALATEFGAPRRAAGQDPPAGEGLWIADTLGELGLLYRLTPTAFVGRSLIAPGGGQNPLEPARLGCAVVVGPHTGNFDDHVSLLRDAGGLVEVTDALTLGQFVSKMLDCPDERCRLGKHAMASVQRHADLPARTAEALLALIAGP